jgi:hypothetical protein
LGEAGPKLTAPGPAARFTKIRNAPGLKVVATISGYPSSFRSTSFAWLKLGPMGTVTPGASPPNPVFRSTQTWFAGGPLRSVMSGSPSRSTSPISIAPELEQGG